MEYENTIILFMVTRNDLRNTVEELFQEGKRVLCVTPLREFREPNMDGVVITDYLIVFEEF